MISDFFINAIILVAVTSVGGHIMKEIPKHKLKTPIYKAFIGVFCGIAGILLLIYSIKIEETKTLIDLRAYAVMMASYAGGMISVLISSIVILLYRFTFDGLNLSSEIAVLQMVLFLINYYMVDKIIKVEWKRWSVKVACTLIIGIFTHYYLLKNVADVRLIILLYSIVMILAGFIEYLLLDYVSTSNELYRRYKKDSTKDFLTGLINTRQFDSVINAAFDQVQQNNETLSCLMIDIDHFKKVNDTYGHAIGDLVLKELSNIIQKSIRTVDVAARIGGEEFCVLLFQASKEQTFEIALRINREVQEHKFYINEDQFIHITVSVGISIYPEQNPNLDTLKGEADIALYKAKQSGRNKVCDHDTCRRNAKVEMN